MAGGWLRRNRWGVLALVPMLGLALVLPVHSDFVHFWDNVPRTAVRGDSAGWVTYAKTRMRLTSLIELSQLTDSLGSNIALPVGVRVWRATISFQSSDPDALDGCDVQMTDSAGAAYEADPAELVDLGADQPYSKCGPDTSNGRPPSTWSNTILFIAPATARGNGVKISILEQNPKYALLTAGTG